MAAGQKLRSEHPRFSSAAGDKSRSAPTVPASNPARSAAAARSPVCNNPPPAAQTTQTDRAVSWPMAKGDIPLPPPTFHTAPNLQAVDKLSFARDLLSHRAECSSAETQCPSPQPASPPADRCTQRYECKPGPPPKRPGSSTDTDP